MFTELSFIIFHCHSFANFSLIIFHRGSHFNFARRGFMFSISLCQVKPRLTFPVKLASFRNYEPSAESSRASFTAGYWIHGYWQPARRVFLGETPARKNPTMGWVRRVGITRHATLVLCLAELSVTTAARCEGLDVFHLFKTSVYHFPIKKATLFCCHTDLCCFSWNRCKVNIFFFFMVSHEQERKNDGLIQVTTILFFVITLGNRADRIFINV